MHYFPNFIFGLALYMFRAVPLPMIRSSTTVHSALVHVIQVLKAVECQAKNKIWKIVHLVGFYQKEIFVRM
jgi:hypothetical protein